MAAQEIRLGALTLHPYRQLLADGVPVRLGRKPLGVEGYEGGEWVLIDLDDVIIHVFRGEKREQFDLERLWGDAPIWTFEEGEGGTVSQRQLP